MLAGQTRNSSWVNILDDMAWMHDCDNWVINSTRANSKVPIAVLLLWLKRRSISPMQICSILLRAVRRLRSLCETEGDKENEQNRRDIMKTTEGRSKNPR